MSRFMSQDKRSPAIFTFTPNLLARRQRSRKDPCIYCGGVGNTKDHVVPANLYTPDDAHTLQLQTVSACRICNEAKSLFDAPLRDFLVFDVDSSQHPKAEELFPDLERSLVANHSRMFDRFYEGRTYPLFDQEGRFDALGWEFPASSDGHIEAVNWITRGMHWVVFKERTVLSSVQSALIDRYRRRELMLEIAIRGGHQAHFMQGEQYACTYAQGADGRVYWHHIFFDSVLFVSRSWRSTERRGF